MSEWRFFHVERARGLSRLGTLEEAWPRWAGGYIWIDLFDPRGRSSTRGPPLGIHPLAVEDCLDENQVPKVEDYPATPCPVQTATPTQTTRWTIEE